MEEVDEPYAEATGSVDSSAENVEERGENSAVGTEQWGAYATRSRKGAPLILADMNFTASKEETTGDGMGFLGVFLDYGDLRGIV